MGGDTTTPTIGTGDDPFGLVGACLEGKYDIQAVVAEGGFGVVYRGVHRSLHKTIAVKVLKVPEGLSDALRKEFLGKFAQEARTIAQFEHPALVRVIDFGAAPMPVGEAAPWNVPSRETLDNSPAECWRDVSGSIRRTSSHCGHAPNGDIASDLCPRSHYCRSCAACFPIHARNQLRWKAERTIPTRRGQNGGSSPCVSIDDTSCSAAHRTDQAFRDPTPAIATNPTSAHSALHHSEVPLQ